MASGDDPPAGPAGRINEHDAVRLVTDRFAAESAPAGTAGYILVCHDAGAFEVEVSDPATGTSLAQFVARAADLTLARSGRAADKARVRAALVDVLCGQALAVPVFTVTDHDGLRGAAAQLGGPLLLTCETVVAVLQRLARDDFALADAQRWASFVRRGYVAGQTEGPITPLAIAVDDRCVDAVAAAVSRLDEIGDAVDGTVSAAELQDLIFGLLRSRPSSAGA